MPSDHPENPKTSADAGLPPPLRFGIMCNSFAFAAWEAACIDAVTATGLAIPALVILNDSMFALAQVRLRQIFEAAYDPNLFWRLYWRMVMKRLPAYKPQDMSAKLSSVPSILCKVERKGNYSEHFFENDIERIRDHRLDFIIRFGFGNIRGQILDLPRHGIWSYHHGDLDKYRGIPPGFWEIYHDDPVCGVTLQRLTNRLDGSVVLHRGHFKTIAKSYVRSLDTAIMASTDFAARVVRDIVSGAGRYFDASASKTKAPIFYAPRNAEMIRFVARMTLCRLKDMYGWLFNHAQWNVGVIDQPIHAFLADGFKPEIRWLAEPPRDRFFADPFAVADDAGLTLLVEEYDFNIAKGHLSVMDCRDGKEKAEVAKIMDTPFHLSYPYTFAHDGSIYCVPEMSQANRVELFRAVVFPMQWERVVTLLKDFNAVDATVFQHHGLWWMFCARTHRNEWIKLYAFYASDLTGPWQAHAGNPLKTDIRSSRPAGTPFVYEGKLYRPAQDCSRAYGGAVAINLVSRLTPTEFEETVCRVFALDASEPYSAGCHTLSAAGARTVIDGKRLIFQPSEFRREATAILRRIVPRWG
jgi:hypothetical protein